MLVPIFLMDSYEPYSTNSRERTRMKEVGEELINLLHVVSAKVVKGHVVAVGDADFAKLRMVDGKELVVRCASLAGAIQEANGQLRLEDQQ